MYLPYEKHQDSLMTLPNHRRKAAFDESYFICRNVEKYYSNFNVVGQYNKHFSKATLSNALKSMIAKNPWLTYNFFHISDKEPVDYHTDYELRCVDSITFDKVVEYRQIDKFDEKTFETINEFSNKINCTDAPLWQLCVFETDESQYVCGYFCHTLHDGGTALQFQKDLVRELEAFEHESQVVENLFDYEKAKYELPDILPARELMTDLYIPGIFQRVKLWMNVKFPIIVGWFRRSIDYLKSFMGISEEKSPVFASFAVTKDLSSKFKIVNFSPQQVRSMTQYCRANNITLTPLFNVVAQDCIEKLIFPHYSRPDGFYEYASSHFIAINGRRFFPQFSNPFLYGVFVAGAPTTFDYMNIQSKDEFLPHIKRFHSMIYDELKSRRSFKLMWTWAVADISKALQTKIGKSERYTTMISNLGMVKDDPQSSWKIVNAWFGLNTSIGYHFILNMTTTETGGLNLVIPYFPAYGDLEMEVNGEKVPVMDQFVTQFRRSCQEIIEAV